MQKYVCYVYIFNSTNPYQGDQKLRTCQRFDSRGNTRGAQYYKYNSLLRFSFKVGAYSGMTASTGVKGNLPP